MQNRGATGIGIAAGSYVWTTDGPCVVEAVDPGDRIVGFDPDLFTRVHLAVRSVYPLEGSRHCQVLAGGRLVEVDPSYRFPVYDIDGNWEPVPAAALEPGSWIPVDRQVPVTPHPVALPDFDQALDALLGSDPLALADALHSRDKYFAEMNKRGVRLRFFELLGYMLPAAEVIGDDLVLGSEEARALVYYRDVFKQTVGQLAGQVKEGESWPVARHVRGWLGEGLESFPQRALPSWVWTLESQARATLLRGFFDAAATVTQEVVRVEHASYRLLTGVQALLGTLGIEAAIERAASPDTVTDLYRLTIRNVRRFAEWIHSNVTAHAATLRVVYRREPRYPTDRTAILPLAKVRPALERIRAAHAFPRRTEEQADERDAANVATLRLLTTAFHDPELRELVNGQLYLEPVMEVREVAGGTLFALTTQEGYPFVINGIIGGGRQEGALGSVSTHGS